VNVFIKDILSNMIALENIAQGNLVKRRFFFFCRLARIGEVPSGVAAHAALKWEKCSLYEYPKSNLDNNIS